MTLTALSAIQRGRRLFVTSSVTLMRPASDMSVVHFITSSRLLDPVICDTESLPLGQNSRPGKTGSDQFMLLGGEIDRARKFKSTLLQQAVWPLGVFSTSSGTIFNDL
jgi:hypothetical protein